MRIKICKNAVYCGYFYIDIIEKKSKIFGRFLFHYLQVEIQANENIFCDKKKYEKKYGVNKIADKITGCCRKYGLIMSKNMIFLKMVFDA